VSNLGCVSAAALALLAMASSCSRGHPREIIADAPLQVLENASPLDYPSTNPRPNKVLDTVPVGGRLLVIGRGTRRTTCTTESSCQTVGRGS